MRRDIRSGFTLVEILIVVVILGILAAIVVPRFAGASDEARAGVFVTNLKAFAEAGEYYNAREGRYPIDGGSGTVPSGMEPYLRDGEFTNGTPLGGVWDYEFADNGIGAGVGVHFNDGSNPGDARMTIIDATFDDGDLTTGVFQRIAGDRYYYIMRP